MRFIVYVSVVFLVSLQLAQANVETADEKDYSEYESNETTLASLEDFYNWMNTHNKEYKSHDEIRLKFRTFQSNQVLVQKLNQLYRGKTEFVLNKFADMSQYEFKSKILIKNLNIGFEKLDLDAKTLPLESASSPDNLPDSFDWRSKGAVTPIKDQGSVGTCWAHSATENLEGVYFLKGNPLTSLSVEQIVDCDGYQSAAGDEHADCGVYGGWPYLAFEFIKGVGGIASEESYPYCAGLNTPCTPCGAPGYNKTKCGPPIPYCYLKDSCQAKLKMSNFVPNLKVVDWKLISQNETDMAEKMMNYGPLSVALNAELLQFYHKGIFNPLRCDPTNLDHAVLLVGWGADKSNIHGNQPFWIVKNSWGVKWGEQGYFRILRNKGKCGINTQVATAILE